LLWKAIIEDFIVEVLAYFYPTIETQRDKRKKIEFLDKFLQTLHPEAVEGNRRADLLIKVPLKNGKEKWILLHIEVQGYQDKDLPRRMFTYYYRSLDRFGMPVESLVIFTDSNKKYRPNAYEYDGIRTKCKYEYPIFKLADYKMADFEDLDSPLGIIFQTALIGMQQNLKDEKLLELKKTLHRKLLEKGYDKRRIQIIGNFIRDLIRFKNKKYNRIFVEEVNKINQNNRKMGVIETVIIYNRKDAQEIGMFIALLTQRMNFLQKFRSRNFTNEDLADMMNISLSFVKDFKKVYIKDKFNVLLKIIGESGKIEELEELIDVKRFLIKKMADYGFSKLALVEYFKMKNKEIEQIIKKK